MDILRKCSGYEFFIKLDINLQYYTFKLDEYSQDICTIITPLGKHKYLRLPMGLKCSPDIAQSIMESVLAGIDDPDVYIDNIGGFSHTWDDHVKLLGKISHRLHKNSCLLTHLNVNGPSKKLTGWVIGLLYGVKNHGRKK
ncbi:hypothetical protein ACHAW6_002949 [Cyclotella cf. meneghiniana]